MILLRYFHVYDILNDYNITRMIFYSLAHLLKLNVFSQLSTTNKHSFTIIIGTVLWSVLWQFTRSYTGNNIIIKSIHVGFYYIVIADLYTMFMASNVIYNDNTSNKNFHNVNYYDTLKMQPINTTLNKLSVLSNDNDEDVVSEVSEDVPIIDEKQDEIINTNDVIAS